MKKAKYVSLLLVLSLVFVLLAGCGTRTGDTAEAGVDTFRPVVGTLKGPTGMGMAKLMTDHSENGKYAFSLFSAPEEITAALIKGDVDMASVPVNLAAVIRQKTGGAYRIAAVNTLGVLYILENGDTVRSLADLAGKKLYATGQGSTPEYILNYLLEQNGITGTEIEYLTEHAELTAQMAADRVLLGMLPEPNVTTALEKNPKLRIALDLTAEWEKLGRGKPVQGCLVVSEEMIREHKPLLDAFLAEYRASADFANGNLPEAADMIESLGILPSAAIAGKALPNCNIVYMEGEEMIRCLTPFYAVLFASDPASVGGVLPDETCYYRK